MVRLFCLLLCVAGWPGLPGAGAATGVPTAWWDGLDAHDLQGAPVMAGGRWTVIVFLSPECPVANAEIPVLNVLAADFSPRGFDFFGAYADPTLGLPELRRHVAERQQAFPAIDDRAQRLVRATGATYTPEAVVLSPAGVVLYRGRIDDRAQDFGSLRPKATHEDLREVLAALAAGASGPFPSQRGFGCSLPEPVKP